MTNRSRGLVLGLAVGDALGTTYEFARLDQPAYPTLATGPATDVVGGGPFNLGAGQVTDDTQLAVCLARSLTEHRSLRVDDVARRYAAWTTEAFDIGNQTHSALSKIINGEPPATAGLATWRDSGHRAAGNGSLMRTAPLVLAVKNRNALIDAAIAESMITHADPRCSLACAAFDAAASDAIEASDASEAGRSGAQMVSAAREALAVGARRLTALWHDSAEDVARVAAAKGDLERDLDAALAADPSVYGAELDMHRTAGFVRVAFRLAFWHAVHTPSWRDAVVDVASRGGDADTNAAIVGALLGARDGDAAIPAAWIDRVLGATQPGSTAWADAHHPRHLLVGS